MVIGHIFRIPRNASPIVGALHCLCIRCTRGHKAAFIGFAGGFDAVHKTFCVLPMLLLPSFRPPFSHPQEVGFVADAHHIRFAQLRALGRKVSDEFTVPLCRTHHRQVHQTGNEASWWQQNGIDPLCHARALWSRTRPAVNGHSEAATPTHDDANDFETTGLRQ